MAHPVYIIKMPNNDPVARIRRVIS